jgi:uncharacterized coiled-coil protein SlyX
VNPDRIAYVEANAVGLVEALEARCARQQQELARLNQSQAAVRAERDRLRDWLHAIWETAAEALRRDQPALLHQIEADARFVLGQSGIIVGDSP